MRLLVFQHIECEHPGMLRTYLEEEGIEWDAIELDQGENIPENKKSIALNVIIQSSEKTLTDEDLDRINQLIISTVETKTGAKIRS